MSMVEKRVGIYGLRNTINGKWYVGQSVNVHKRWTEYSNYLCPRQPKLFNALKKYGYDTFEKILLEECDNVDWILDYREMYWIRYLGSFIHGYNCTEGGGGMRGRKMPAAERETRRQKALGRKLSAATIEKLKNRVISNDTRKKMQISATGRTHSEYTKQKISALQRGRPGKKHSADTIEKLRRISTGKKQSVETINKRVLKMMGHVVSEETRRKISDARRGQKLSDETRRKLCGRKRSDTARQKMREAALHRYAKVKTARACESCSECRSG